MTAIDGIDQVYACSLECEIWDQPVEHSGARAYVTVATRLLRGLGETGASDLWRPSVLVLRRTRRLLCNVPLSFDDPHLQLSGAAAQLAAEAVRLAPVADADSVDGLHRAAQLLAWLASSDDDPLGDCVRDFLTLDDVRAGIVVVPDRRFLEAVSQAMAHRGVAVQAGTEADLAGGGVHGSAAVVGPPRWLKPGLLNAPRARNLALVHYDFFREEPAVEPMLYGPAVSTGVVRPVQRSATFYSGAGQEHLDEAGAEPADRLTADECSLGEEIRAVFPASRSESGHANARDQVRARAALLADGSHVLLPVDADARILTLRTQLLPEVRLEQVPASSVGCGDYLVLRSKPHHQDLTERADVLLGADANSLRATQNMWKDKLWERTEAHPRGIRGVADDLRRAGADTANVSYWISGWCIRPRSKSDFAVVLRYLRIFADLDETWEHLRRIDSAHRSAGQRYAEDILRAATPERTNRLLAAGWCAVTPGGVDRETVVITRVEHLLPETLVVPLNVLCRLRATEDS
ncbi:hypothetical protein [Streptacidiphilus melanogenes]|uniref:hypothetical protein n=1 Tax=Streptacidiphilus melanogenes TaxID=411235 RepID=UPI0005A82990|nr:hypothetical protein [Streptacidiphilus melanogenes]